MVNRSIWSVPPTNKFHSSSSTKTRKRHSAVHLRDEWKPMFDQMNSFYTIIIIIMYVSVVIEMTIKHTKHDRKKNDRSNFKLWEKSFSGCLSSCAHRLRVKTWRILCVSISLLCSLWFCVESHSLSVVHVICLFRSVSFRSNAYTITPVFLPFDGFFFYVNCGRARMHGEIKSKTNLFLDKCG